MILGHDLLKPSWAYPKSSQSMIMLRMIIWVVMPISAHSTFDPQKVGRVNLLCIGNMDYFIWFVIHNIWLVDLQTRPHKELFVL